MTIMQKIDLASEARRSAEIVALPKDEERRAEISFSSEIQYFRHDGGAGFYEVLGHKEEEVDLSRLNSGAAPLLKDHHATLDSQIGVIERAWLVDGKGRAIVRFSDTPSGNDILARVRAGEVTCVSVGYDITQAKEEGRKEGIPIIRATSWTPREISFVAIPADPSVGYGRKAGTQKPPLTIPLYESATMPKDIPNSVTEETSETDNFATPSRQDIIQEERARINGIEEMARRHDLPAEMVQNARNNGTDLASFQTKVLDFLAGDEATSARFSASQIGLSKQEMKRYSLTNVIRYLNKPTEKNRSAAGFELEASRAFADQVGNDPQGVYLPPDILMDGNFNRAQNTGTSSEGGVLVPTDYRPGDFISLLRNQSALSGLGVRILQGLTGNVDIPKQASGPTLYWFGEDGEPDESKSEYGNIQLTPHSAGIEVAITRRMIQQSSPDIEALIRDDLVKAMALGIDHVALMGSDSPDAPTGLHEILAPDAITWEGEYATLSELIDMETAVFAKNANSNNMAYIYGAHSSGHFKKTYPDAPGVVHPIEYKQQVNDYPRVRTNQVSEADVFFGGWDNLIIGMWSGIDLRVDTSTKAKSDGRVLRAFVDIDTAQRHKESFKLGKRAA